MALKEYSIATVGPFGYDDADCDAFATDGQMTISGAPTDPAHVARLQDLPNGGTPGYDGTITVITNVQLTGGAIEVKSRQITFTDGIVTTMGAESGWTATPL